MKYELSETDTLAIQSIIFKRGPYNKLFARHRDLSSLAARAKVLKKKCKVISEGTFAHQTPFNSDTDCA